MKNFISMAGPVRYKLGTVIHGNSVTNPSIEMSEHLFKIKTCDMCGSHIIERLFLTFDAKKDGTLKQNAVLYLMRVRYLPLKIVDFCPDKRVLRHPRIETFINLTDINLLLTRLNKLPVKCRTYNMMLFNILYGSAPAPDFTCYRQFGSLFWQGNRTVLQTMFNKENAEFIVYNYPIDFISRRCVGGITLKDLSCLTLSTEWEPVFGLDPVCKTDEATQFEPFGLVHQDVEELMNVIMSLPYTDIQITKAQTYSEQIMFHMLGCENLFEHVETLKLWALCESLAISSLQMNWQEDIQWTYTDDSSKSEDRTYCYDSAILTTLGSPCLLTI